MRVQIPVRITGLDPLAAFSERCHTLLINPLGCGIRFPRSLKPGMQLRIDDLPGRKSITARVASNVPPSGESKYWIVGIGWDAPGNICRLAPVPADWAPPASPFNTADTGILSLGNAVLSNPLQQNSNPNCFIGV